MYELGLFKDKGPDAHGDLRLPGRRPVAASSGRSKHHTGFTDILDHWQASLRLLVFQKNW